MTQADLLPEVPSIVPPPGKSDEFYTPRALFEFFNADLRFDLDVCATRESARCPRYFTAKDNGLAQDWGRSVVWCNPPYSDIEPWAAKIHELFASGRGRTALLLPPVNRTEQPWWQTYVEPFRDLPMARIRVPRVVQLASGRTVSVPVVHGCKRRRFTLEAHFLGKRIPFGFPGDVDGITSEGGKFASVALIWRHSH